MKIVNEITPQRMECVVGACPSIFETDRGTYILIGKELGIEDAPEKVRAKIGVGETAMEVPKELITKLYSKD